VKPLLTARLTLRLYVSTDFKALAAILSDAEVMKHVFMGRPFSDEETRQFLQRHFATTENDPFGLAILCERETSQVLGCAGIIPFDDLEVSDYEFGFLFGKFAWGKGFATEIARELVRHGLHDLGLQRLTATVHPANEASRRVLGKAGLHYMKDDEVPGRGLRQIFCTTQDRHVEA